MRHLKSNLVDKLVSLTGNLVRVSNVRPLITSMWFECEQCAHREYRHFPDGRYDPPVGGCAGLAGRCKNKVMHPERFSASAVDFQSIRVQELIGSEQIDQGRIPRSIECELTHDLVDAGIPGDLVTVTGIVKVAYVMWHVAMCIFMCICMCGHVNMCMWLVNIWHVHVHVNM